MAVLSKVFRSGNSEAVRLPKEVAFGENVDVVIERTGDVLTIRPVVSKAEQRARVQRLAARLLALEPIEIEQRPPFDGPERDGLA